MKMNVYIHPYVCIQVYWYKIHFVVKLLDFICMCIREKTFYPPKFQLQALGLCSKLMWQLVFTTWYSQFLMSQYSNLKWIKHFKVNIEFFFELTMKLKACMEKKKNMLQVCSTCGDSHCIFILHVCTLSKIPLVQQIVCHWQIHYSFGALRIYLCSEYLMLRNQVKWHEGKEMVEVMVGFKHFCGLPFVHGVIDLTQIHI